MLRPILAAALAALSAATLAPAARADAPSPPEEVRFVNDLPGPYRLVRVRLVVDGVQRYDAAQPFDVLLAPGRHNLDVIADYRLDDPLLTYVRDYAIELRAAHVTQPAAAPVRVIAAAVERGGETVPLDRRAAIAWQEQPAR